jgi:putative ABC transport system permease protein
LIEPLTRNLRYAIRSLLRTPGFTATVVLTLALGIGANIAVFSALDAVLLKPLPYPDPDRLVRVRQTAESTGATDVVRVRLTDWDRLSSSFDAISGYLVEDLSDTTGAEPERVRRATVLPGFTKVWGISPAIGRSFTDADHQAGRPATVVLISDRYWRRRLAADPEVLTKTVRFGNRSYQVVGVMPRAFVFPDREVDWWTPEWINAPWMTRTAAGIIGIGRLRPGVTLGQAHADLARVQAGLARSFPDTDRDLRPAVASLKDDLVGDSRASLWLLFAAVSLLLLIVCSNIASLLLSRGAQRRPEIAVRYSLGATRRAVIMQLLTEAGVLAAIGGAAGLLVASALTLALQRLASNVERLSDAGMDARLTVYSVVTVAVVTLVCGVVPAWRAAGARRLQLDAGARIAPRHSLQWTLAGLQVALSVALLSGAGLLLQSAAALARVDAGFDATHVLAFRISGSFGEDAFDRTIQRINRTLDELEALPGVRAAATTTALSGVSESYLDEYELTGAPAGERVIAQERFVSPSYFATMTIPVVSGELCRRPETARVEAPEAMVNRSFVRRYVGNRQAIGLVVAGRRITGIVADARERALNLEPEPTVYFCYSAPSPFPHFLVRTTDTPAAAAAVVRRRIRQLEPLRSVYNVTPLDERIGDAYTNNRLRTTLLTAFAASALLLACLGVYGTLSYVVGLRRREVGLRLALGARRSGIVWRFVWEGVRVAAVAAAAGLVLALTTSRLVAGMLFGVTPSDPETLGAVVAIVLLVVAIASFVPAARAARIEPMRVLREE